jgi:hypothetical protein
MDLEDPSRKDTDADGLAAFLRTTEMAPIVARKPRLGKGKTPKTFTAGRR